MNNAISIALMRIHTQIPKEILELMFKDREPWESTYTIDQLLIDHVLRYRILKNLNIFGGKIKDIFLRPEYREKLHYTKDDAFFHTGPFSIYRIPVDEREGLDMLEVIEIRYASQYHALPAHPYVSSHGTTIAGMGSAILDSHTMANSPPRPLGEVLSGQMIRLSPSQRSELIWVARVKLAHADTFENLNTSALDTFGELAVWTTRLIARTRLVIPVDKAYVQAGYEISEIGKWLSAYENAEEKCRELEEELVGAVNLDPKMLESYFGYML